MTEISARVRNLILALAGMGALLVAYGYLSGVEWVQFVGGLVKGLLA